MCIDETIASDIKEAVARVSCYLDDFGSHISHLYQFNMKLHKIELPG
jgi:hypothetical protein